MGSWQERMSAEINRRELQAKTPTQKPIETPKVVPLLSYEKREEIKVNAQVQVLKPHERNAFGLLGRIGAEQMLREIRDQVWGGYGEVDSVGKITKEKIAPGRTEDGIVKGLRLRFKYHYSKPGWDHSYDRSRHFGSYKEIHVGSSVSQDGSQYTTSYSKNKFGLHYVNHHYNFVARRTPWSDFIDIEIAIVRKGSYEDYPRYGEQGVVLRCRREHKLNTWMGRSLDQKDEGEARKWLEERLLDECIERQKRQNLPTDILKRIQQNEKTLDQAIKDGRKFYYNVNGRYEVPYDSSIGLVTLLK